MKREGFPKGIRIKKESEFRAIMRRGQKSQGDHLILFRLAGQALQGQRFGIKIARGFEGAVQRNRVKRAIREVLRHNRQRFDQDESVVVVCKHSAGQRSSVQLSEELEGLIR
jgi:ribonuclease P protein component